MWYVIQTKSGDEQELKLFLERILPADVQANFFLPLYENVWRREGRGHISIQRMFPGYIFCETEEPSRIFEMLKKVPRFTRLLNMKETDGEHMFMAVSTEDQTFLESLLEDGVMCVSYIHRDQKGCIDQLVGPLSAYEQWITRLDVPHRRAIVETHIFGKERTIKFGLWTDVDPLTPRLRKLRQMDSVKRPSMTADIGIYIGDLVRDKNDIYTDMKLTVTEVDSAHRIVWVAANLFGTTVRIEMDADSVEVVEEQ